MSYKSLRTLSDCQKHGAVLQVTCRCGRLTWKGTMDFTHPPDRAKRVHGWVEIEDLAKRLRCRGCGHRAAEIRVVHTPPVPKGVPVLPFLNADDRERKRMIRIARG
jgi:hypothetical protein